MRIINKLKFFRMICFLIFIIMVFIFFTNKTYSISKVEYKEEYVYAGDTLWSIANHELEENKYFQNKDIRDIVLEIKSINNLTNSNLYEGEKIKIPVYE